MKAYKDNAIWVSEKFQQGSAETDWKEFQSEVEINARDSVLNNSKYYLAEDSYFNTNGSSITIETVSNWKSLHLENSGYTGNNHSASGQDSICMEVCFSTDGEKFYVVGDTNNRIYQYSLATAWDLSSTVTYNGFYTSTQATYPTGIAFKGDGTKMYILCSSTDSVYEYTITTAWDITGTVSYTTNSFSVQTQETLPNGIDFSSDGTKFYIVGTSADTVFEYSLSTAWDLGSTVQYTNNNHSVVSQAQTPHSVRFSADGTKFYILNYNFAINDSVIEYSLSTAWDLSSTVTYTGNNFSIDSQETYVQGLAIGNGGNSFYVIGRTNNTVYEYSCPKLGFDFLSYSNNSFSVGTQEGTPYDIHFSSDGKKFYIVGDANDRIYEYTVSIAWDLSSTVAYSGNSYDAGANGGNNLRGLYFKPDGKTFYVASDTSETVYSFNLETAWDLSSTVTTSSSESISTQIVTDVHGLTFSTDGTKMYVMDDNPAKIFEYTLTTAWDLGGTVTYNQAYTVSFDSSPKGLVFSENGTQIYVTGDTNNKIFVGLLSTAWDISTISVVNGLELSVGSQDAAPTGICFSSNYSKLFIVGDTNNTVYEYGATSDVKITSSFGQFTPTNTPKVYEEVGVVVGMANDPGLIPFVSSSMGAISSTTSQIVLPYDNNADPIIEVNDNVVVKEFNQNQFNSTYMSQNANVFDATSHNTDPNGACFSTSGHKLYVWGDVADEIIEYNLAVPFDITSTATLVSEEAYSYAAPQDIFFKPDGTKVFIVTEANDIVREHSLTTAWDISTLSATPTNSYTTSSADGLFFNAEGTKFYRVDSSADVCRQYSLTTAWSLASVTLDGNYSLPLEGGTNNAKTCCFTGDGKRFLTWDSAGDEFRTFTCGTLWDTSNLTVQTTFSTSPDTYRNFFFNTDGTKLWAFNTTSDELEEYDISYSGTSATTTVSSVSVSGGETTVGFGTQSFAPFILEASAKGGIGTNPASYTYDSVNDRITTISDVETLGSGRTWCQFRAIGDSNTDVNNIKINLWKE